MTHDGGYRLGVDVGGAFTDLVLMAPDGRVLTRKVLSTRTSHAARARAHDAPGRER